MPVSDVRQINRDGWNRRVSENDVWSVPVSADSVERARSGDWEILLTPNKPVPTGWLGDVAGQDILCLASGGGQQGPILAAAGARVVVFDASDAQLSQDRKVAERDALLLDTVQGFMNDLSVFPDGRFDLIFHPVSNCYSPEIEPVWRECFRVLRPGGRLLAGFMNPAVYIFDSEQMTGGNLVVRFPLPYSDSADLSSEDFRRIVQRDHTVEFSHSFDTQFGGQLRAGFMIVGMFEDGDREPQRPIGAYMPIYFATVAIKPASGGIKSGGLARSTAKTVAARQNGRKGGRPRKRASAA
jgi:SAM-dependent methyltransferase